MSEPVRYTIVEDDADVATFEAKPESTPVKPMEGSIEAVFRAYIAQYKPNLMIMTPCYNSTVFVPYMQALISTLFMAREFGFSCNVVFCRNDSLVSRARNNLVAKSMHNKDVTHFLFIDADITWSPMDVIKLLLANKPLVGGIYPIKNYKWDILSGQNPQQNIDTIKARYKKSNFTNIMSETDFIKTNLLRYNINYVSNTLNIERNLTKVRHLATGFMMIQRPVFEAMFKAFPQTKYTDDVSFLEGTENNYAYALFDCGVEDDHYFSEDWMFCHRWSKMGGEIFVDVTINLDHTGNETFSGCYLASVI
jgi:hypothetical protein